MQSQNTAGPHVTHETIGDGWLLAVIGNVRVTCFTRVMDDASFAKYCDVWSHHLDSLPADRASGVLHEVVGKGDMDARRRKMLGEVLRTRKEKLARINAGFVMVTSSSITRGIMTAVFWFAPPPYPSQVMPNARDGLAWLAGRTPGGVDVAASLVAYEQLKRKVS